MASSPVEFEIGGKRFEVSRLKVKPALSGLKLVGKVLLPALAEAHAAPAGQLGAAVQKAIEGLDCLEPLLDLFVQVTRVPNPIGGDSMVRMAPFVEDVFAGAPEMTVEYLVKCVQNEYAGFLSGSGPLGALLAQAKTAAIPASISATS